MNDEELRPASPGFRFSLRAMLLVITIVAVLIAIVAPAVSAAREAAHRMEAKNNLKLLALGVHNYHDNWGQLPRAVTYSPSGDSMYGWRYALAVYLTQIGLPVFEDGTKNTHWWYAYDHTKPWNDPTNLAALKGRCEPWFLRPGAKNQSPDCTNFVAVVGPETLFPGDSKRALTDIVDDPTSTIMFVEIDRSDISWYEPRDLEFEQMSYQINDPDRSRPSIGNRRAKGALVVMADSSVHFLPNDTSPETLKAMLTIAGGEKVALP